MKAGKHSNNPKAKREEDENKEYVKEIENKEQDGRLKTSHSKNYIKYNLINILVKRSIQTRYSLKSKSQLHAVYEIPIK